MPPGRRGRPAGSVSRPKNPQQRLSFGPNATNKITKPSPLGQDAKTKKLSPTQKSKLEKELVVDDSPVKSPSLSEEDKSEVEVENRSLPIRRNEKSVPETKVSRDKKEVEALKVSEAQIKKYWILKEEDRIAPRVHQQGLSVHEKILREFDLSSQFGPCIGITRTKRWKRADRMGMKPPLEVLAVLLKGEERSKGTQDVQRAYVDSLMGGVFGEEL